jgi:hypothetical protein
MSAFIVSDLHTFTIAQFVAQRLDEHGLDRDQLAQNIANSLKRVNIESVNHRYSEKTPRTKCKPAQCRSKPTNLTAPEIYRLARCWIYQACENQHSADFHALSALLHAAFTQDEKRASDYVGDLWTI